MLPSQVPTAGFDFPGLQHLETMKIVVYSAATTRMCMRMMMVILLPPLPDETTNHLDAAEKSLLRFLLRSREIALVECAE